MSNKYRKNIKVPLFFFKYVFRGKEQIFKKVQ